MKQYIGDLKQYLKVQYAKSDRSSCRKCKENIHKNQLRIGIHFDDDNFSTDNWFHLKCFEFKPRHRILDIKNIQNHIQGVDQLNKKDASTLLKTLKTDLQQVKDKKRILQKKKDYEQQGKPIPINIEAEQRKKLGKKLIKRTKRLAQQQVITKPHKKEYEKLIQQYEQRTVHQLKDILRKNQQAIIGRKQEIAARCADGKQFGRIPPCPKCGGGKLRFDRQKGLYNCPGYMQDTDFVHCGAKFNFKDVKRIQWIE